MKLRYIIPLIAITLGSSAATAQIQKDSISIKVPEMWSGALCGYQYNYTQDTTGVKALQGDFKVEGVVDTPEENETYLLEGRYLNSKIDGAITCKYSYKKLKNQIKGFRNLEYNGSFKEGLPDGNFKIKSFGHKSSAYDVDINFKDGVLHGNFSFNAFIGKEVTVSGNFSTPGVMDGTWNIRVHNTMTNEIERYSITLSEGILIESPDYNKDLEKKAKLYAEGKISKEALKKEGITIHTYRDDHFVKAVKGAVNSRFIPFDKIGKIDDSKITMKYKYLDYQTEMKGSGFEILLAEMDKYNGFNQPEMSSFGIHYNDTTLLGFRTYDSSFGTHILNPKWSQDSLTTVFFTEEQHIALEKKLEEVKNKWKNSEITRCKFGYEDFITQNIVNKSTEEVAKLLQGDAGKYADYTPITSFQATNITATENGGTKYELDCRIEVEQKDSIGHKTYDWAIVIDGSDWKSMHKSLDKNFSQNSFKRILNKSDEINRLIKTLDSKSSQLYRLTRTATPFLTSESVRNYSIYMRDSVKVSETDFEGSIETINKAFGVQEQFEQWINKTVTVKKNDYQLRLMRKTDKRLIKEYNSRLENSSFVWFPDADISALDSLIEFQTLCSDFVAKTEQIRQNSSLIKKRADIYKDLPKQYSRYFREHKIKWHSDDVLSELDTLLDIQERTVSFIDKREAIASNTVLIVESSSKFKDIKRKYPSYINSVDVTWTPIVDIEKLDKIIEVQNWTLNYIKSQNTILDNHKELKRLRKNNKEAYKEYMFYFRHLHIVWTPENKQAELDAVIEKQEFYKNLLSK